MLVVPLGPVLQIVLWRLEALLLQVDLAGLLALPAGDADHPVLQVDVVAAQVAQLADPKTRLKEGKCQD